MFFKVIDSLKLELFCPFQIQNNNDNNTISYHFILFDRKFETNFSLDISFKGVSQWQDNCNISTYTERDTPTYRIENVKIIIWADMYNPWFLFFFFLMWVIYRNYYN